jgi:hypothetical protein
MYRAIAIAILALSLGGGFALNAPSASAQTVDKKAAAKPAPKPRAVAPRTVAPRVARPAARTVTPRATRTVTPRATRTVTPRATRTVAPRRAVTATPRTGRTATPRVAPRVTPRVTAAPRGRAVTAARIRGVPARGAGRFYVGGRRYSTWRSGYRVRYGGGWRTFVAISALTAIMVGSSQYYPYAYISAPRPYCSGFTADGCELHWRSVETIEGGIISQCVAYCPWQ